MMLKLTIIVATSREVGREERRVRQTLKKADERGNTKKKKSS